MLCLEKPRTYSTFMRLVHVNTDEWNRVIRNPIVRSDKMDAPLLIWGGLSDNVEIDTEYGHPRCTGANISYLKALQVDVDNGCTIDEFVERYARYSFQLYTSYSYGFKEGDRFRAIFPLQDRFPMKYLTPPVKKALMEFFPMVDSTCFDRGHWQIVPCVRSKDAPYKYIQHLGEVMDLLEVCDYVELTDDYEWEVCTKRSLREADFSTRRTPAKHEGALKKAQEVIDNATQGSRNTEIYKILCWLHGTVEIDEDEALSLDFPCDMYEECHGMIDRIWGKR